MTRRMLLGLLALPVQARPAIPNLAKIEKQIFARINLLRASVSLPALEWDGPLNQAARHESNDMAELNFFAHENPERGDLRARLSSAGIRWLRCAENILREKGFDDPVSVSEVEWWYSPGHKENIVNPFYTKTGVGIAISEAGFFFATQIFVTPLPPGARRR